MSLLSHVTDRALTRKLQGIEEYVRKEILRFWHVHAPHFTDHGVTHSEGIVSILDRMIPVDVLGKMNEYEVFFMLCGAWLHDVGMLVKKAGESPEQVRTSHHERGRELIRTGLPHIDLTDDERYVIGEMAFYHRKTEDLGRIKEITEIQHDSSTSQVRLRFLCALLRLADGCEIAHARSSPALVDIAGIEEEAKFHHEAHLHVSAVGFDQITHEVTVYIRAKNQEDANLLTSFLKSSLEKELISVEGILREHGVDYSVVKCDQIIDPYAREMPHLPVNAKEMPLERKLIELEKRAGYYPSMVIEENTHVRIYYETISLTSKELQQEILGFLETIWDVFAEKRMICLTINKIHEPRGTVGESDPEIVAVISRREDFKEYKEKAINERDLWRKLVFLRKIPVDQFWKPRTRFDWPLTV